MFKLKDRIESYQQQSEYKLLNRLPVIILVNGRSFTKTTSLIDKPYSEPFVNCMLSTSLKLCSEVEGTVFCYHNNDEILLVSRNDQTNDTSAWFDNKIQKISSVVSSIATLHFNKCSEENELNLLGDAYFSTKVFTVPNIQEAINSVIFKQQQNFYKSVDTACFYELLKKYDKNMIKEMISGVSTDEKLYILQQECGINFEDYPAIFKNGAACYKTPKLVGDSLKNFWTVNTEIPIFSKNQSLLNYILKNGIDIFRHE